MKRIIILTTILIFSTFLAADYIYLQKNTDIYQKNNDKNLKLIYQSNQLKFFQTKIKQDSEFELLTEIDDDQKLFIGTHPNPEHTVKYSREIGELVYKTPKFVIVKAEIISLDKRTKSVYNWVELKPLRTKHFKKFDKINLESKFERTEMETLVNSVDSLFVREIIQELQDFQTRYFAAANYQDVYEYLHDKFVEIGFEEDEVSYLDYEFYNMPQKNVMATLTGSENPEEYILIGGHYDSINNSGDPMVSAPGADDNASAIAATMAVAKAYLDNDIQPESSIIFAGFGTEEVGLVGSQVLAEHLADNNYNLKMMMNMDMVSNNNRPQGEWRFFIDCFPEDTHLLQVAEDLTADYTTLNHYVNTSPSANSDHYSFHSAGFPIIYFREFDFSPYYHSSDDVIDNCDIPFCTQISRLAAAQSFSIDKIPASVQNLEVIDPGSGTELNLSWESSDENDSYVVAYGNTPYNYTEITETTESSIQLTGLENNNTYYIGVAIKDEEGNQGAWTQVTAVPRLIPLTPQEFSIDSTDEEIQLNWVMNQEMDMSSYELMKRREDEDDFSLLDELETETTEFIDTDLETGFAYFYKIRAKDEDGNTSDWSEIVAGKLISLDHGILIIDDTPDGNGTVMAPSEVESDNFYQYVFSGSGNYDEINAEDFESVGLYNFAEYSTVFWHMDNMNSTTKLSGAQADLKKFVDYGGNLLISGYKSALRMNTSQSDYDFEPGDLIYDYFGVESVERNNTARFGFANPEQDMVNQLNVDADKINPALEGHIFSVSGWNIVGDNGLFSYQNNYGDENDLLVDKFVGTYNQANAGETIILGFPLYACESDEVRAFITTVMEEIFAEEIVDTNDNTIESSSVIVYQNYPNPFNPATNLSFSLKERENVKISIYNLKGQKINSIVDQEFSSGRHNIVWNGKNDEHKEVSSGVYFYRIETESEIKTKKMLLLK